MHSWSSEQRLSLAILDHTTFNLCFTTTLTAFYWSTLVFTFHQAPSPALVIQKVSSNSNQLLLSLLISDKYSNRLVVRSWLIITNLIMPSSSHESTMAGTLQSTICPLQYYIWPCIELYAHYTYYVASTQYRYIVAWQYSWLPFSRP